MPESQLISPAKTPAKNASSLTVFICANCHRQGLIPTARFGRPSIPTIPWPATPTEITVPCTGRLQPEHLLKAFEAGADAVAVVACDESNCHYLEGSCRAARRCDYVGDLLDQIGLDRRRLMLFHLPGSAREDMAAGQMVGGQIQALPLVSAPAPVASIATIAAQVAERLLQLPPTPLRDPSPASEHIDDSEAEEMEQNED